MSQWHSREILNVKGCSSSTHRTVGTKQRLAKQQIPENWEILVKSPQLSNYGRHFKRLNIEKFFHVHKEHFKSPLKENKWVLQITFSCKVLIRIFSSTFLFSSSSLKCSVSQCTGNSQLHYGTSGISLVKATSRFKDIFSPKKRLQIKIRNSLSHLFYPTLNQIKRH